MIKSWDLSILLQSTYLEGDETELFSSTSSDQVKAYCKEYYDYLALSRTYNLQQLFYNWEGGIVCI